MDLSKVEGIFIGQRWTWARKGAIGLMILLASVPVVVMQLASRLFPLLGPSQELHHSSEFYNHKF